MCTLLIVTLPREDKGPLSMTRGVKSRAVNFEKICAVNDMSRAFVSGEIDIDEAAERCSEIYHAPNFRFSTRALGYAINGAGFAVMVGGGLTEGILSFFIALLMGVTLVYFSDKKVPFFFGPLMGGLVTGLVACLFHLFLPGT
ncbi:MAG: threonine/serine exporter family protein, partial [Anaerotignum sp.]|nr:threonine/serine exporter family protein [Anaerotignum sp.]